MLIRSTACSTLLLFSSMVLAQDQATDLESITVTATRMLSLDEPTTAGSRLNLTSLQTPASVATLSGERIRELGIPTLALAKTQAPGITSNNSPGNGNNNLSARGFNGTNSVKQLYNGMEIYNAGGVVSFPFDPWNAERIEVLYGPASVLYGAGAIGGAINVVPRRPDPTVSRRETELTIGEFDSYHVALGSTGPISERLSYRADASHYRSDGWVEDSDSESLAISASLRFDVTPDFRLVLSNDYGSQQPSNYLGTPVLNGTPVPGLRYENYNIADSNLYFGDNWTNLELTWNVSDTLSVHNNSHLLLHERRYRDVTVFTYQPASQTVRRTSYRDIDDTYQTQYGDNGYVKWASKLFGRDNHVLVGIDVNRSYYHREDNVRGGSSTVAAINPTPGNYRDAYDQESKPFYTLTLIQYGAFAENRFVLNEQLSLVAGLRKDHYDVNRYDSLQFRHTDSGHDSTGWNIGVVYNPIPSLALYGQYALASDPVNSLASIGIDQQAFSLSDGVQLEFGVKGSLWRDRIAWTFAAYDIVKEGLLTPSVADPSISEQVGQQSSRGLEASLAIELGPVRLDMNGTVLDAQFDDFSASVDGALVSLAGNVPVNVPEQAANVRLSWDITEDWQARASLRHVGKRYSANTNTPASVMPDYSVLDVGVRWLLSPTLQFDARLDNAFDEIYATSGSTTQWILGQPRTFALAMRMAF